VARAIAERGRKDPHTRPQRTRAAADPAYPDLRRRRNPLGATPLPPSKAITAQPESAQARRYAGILELSGVTVEQSVLSLYLLLLFACDRPRTGHGPRGQAQWFRDACSVATRMRHGREFFTVGR